MNKMNDSLGAIKINSSNSFTSDIDHLNPNAKLPSMLNIQQSLLSSETSPNLLSQDPQLPPLNDDSSLLSGIINNNKNSLEFFLNKVRPNALQKYANLPPHPSSSQNKSSKAAQAVKTEQNAGNSELGEQNGELSFEQYKNFESVLKNLLNETQKKLAQAKPYNLNSESHGSINFNIHSEQSSLLGLHQNDNSNPAYRNYNHSNTINNEVDPLYRNNTIYYR